MARDRRAPVRLLPVRADHGGGGAAQEEAEADRPGHRRGDDQYLPLRHLPAHPRSGAYRGRNQRREGHYPRQWPVQGIGRSAMKKSIRKAAKLSRRKFIVGSAAAGGGLALGFHLPGMGVAEAQTNGGVEVNAWVVVKPDDTCMIRIARSEMGQGTLTGLAQLVAEELECDWKKVVADR